MGEKKTDVLQGTLDLLVLRTLTSLGPMHGWGIARRIEQASEDALSMNQGTLYPALLRLEQRGWIRSQWGPSGNNRRPRFHTITPKGKRQLQSEEERWDRIAAIIARIRQPFPEEGEP